MATPEALTVLIVDDSSMMRTLLKRAISLADMPVARVLEAGDGQQALQLLRAEHVDALLTDINMPVMSGMELLTAIAADPRFAGLTRVIISTDGSESRRGEAERLGVAQYLNKPFRPEAIRDALSQLVARS